MDLSIFPILVPVPGYGDIPFLDSGVSSPGWLGTEVEKVEVESSWPFTRYPIPGRRDSTVDVVPWDYGGNKPYNVGLPTERT